MNNFEREKHKVARKERDVEIIDLDLADYTEGNLPRFAYWFLMWQRTLNRGRVRWVLSLSILFLAVFVFLLTVHGSFLLPAASYKNSVVQTMAPPLPANIQPALVILPQKDGLACLADMSWSLDSRYLAFVGYQKPCALVNDLYEPGRIALYDAATGQVVGQMRPDDDILPALQEQFARMYGMQIISYHHILWSPIGQSLAITFTIDFPTASSPSRVDGVLLTSLDGKHVKVLLQAQNYTFSYTEWDVHLFDSFTGYEVASLVLPVNTGLHLSGNVLLQIWSGLLHWSPDGTHVLLFDPLRGSAVIWDVS